MVDKEKDIQRLRELQEKASDRQAEIDQIRAKRAQEENERLARRKESEEALKREKVNKTLAEARAQQRRR